MTHGQKKLRKLSLIGVSEKCWSIAAVPGMKKKFQDFSEIPEQFMRANSANNRV